MAEETLTQVQTDIKKYYETFLADGKQSAQDIATDLNLDDEYVSNVIAQVIVGAMRESINAVKIEADINRLAIQNQISINESNANIKIKNSTGVSRADKKW